MVPDPSDFFRVWLELVDESAVVLVMAETLPFRLELPPWWSIREDDPLEREGRRLPPRRLAAKEATDPSWTELDVTEAVSSLVELADW